MITRLKAEGGARQERLQYALDTLHAQDRNQSDLAQKIAAAKTTWLVAGLVDGLDRCYQPPPIPDEFTILATDGSHIAVDRHRSTRCYLINIGEVILRYGQNPDATLDSHPSLYSGEEEMAIAPSSVKDREQPIEGNLLGLKRNIDECHRLATLAKELPSGSLSLALADGSLILWGLEAYPDFVTEALLTRGFLSYLTEIEKLNEPTRKVALASYISFPRSTEVINALRVALCPREVLDTDYCGECKTRECDAIASIRDRELFMDILKPRERSALFTSGSRFVQKHYGGHQVYFFYLRVDDEVARIELPRWVAFDENLLNLAHSLILDQCQRGQGYPVALSEAHEQAVVTAADRENFWQLVESALVTEHLPSLSSAKSQSKKTRWV
ncbi:DNA double-strand break repair nuclease NurA [Chloroflexota bacterium]